MRKYSSQVKLENSRTWSTACIMGCLLSGRKILIWNCLHKLFYYFTTYLYVVCTHAVVLDGSICLGETFFCSTSSSFFFLCLHFLETVKFTFIALSKFYFARKLPQMCENGCYIENWDFCQLFERLGARKLTILTDRKNIDHFLTFHQRMRNELQYSHIMGVYMAKRKYFFKLAHFARKF